MINIKTLFMAAAVSGGLVLAMPTASQAMPTSAPVIRMNAVQNGNIVQAKHDKHWRRWSRHDGRRWRHYRFARSHYCDPWDGCYRHHRRFYSDWDDPYYGYGYPYEPYYGGYYGGPGFYGPGIGLEFRIH
jgi:hypothetical protein